MDRRKFVVNSGVTFGLLNVPFIKKRPTATQNNKLYLAQSGQVKNDPYLFVGALLSKSSNIDESALVNFRNALNFTSEFKYSDNNKYKKSYAENCIDFFTDQQSLTLFIKGVGNGQNSLVQSSFYNRMGSKVDTILEIIDETRTTPSTTEIIKKPEYTFGSTQTFFNLVNQNSQFTITDVPYWQSNLLQLACFLTSAVRADYGQHPSNNVNKDLVQKLKVNLGVTSLSNTIPGKIIHV